MIFHSEQLTDFERSDEKNSMPPNNSDCMSHQLKDLLSLISTGDTEKESNNYESSEANDLDDQNEISFEALEAKLIIKAKMEYEKNQMMREESDRLNLSDLSDEQKEILQNLLLSSVADLENCCDDCLATYTDLHDFIKSKSLEFNLFNDYVDRLSDNLINQHETKLFQFIKQPEIDYGYNENYCNGN